MKNHSIRVLHLNQDLAPERGGIARLLHDFAPDLRASGARLIAATAEPDTHLPEGFSAHECLPELASVRADPAAWQLKLERILARHRIDVAHVHEVQNVAIIEHLAHTLPVFIHLHNYHVWCPGRDLFHAAGETICPRSAGWRCIPNAYLKRCTNRNPIRLYRSLADTYRKLALGRTASVRFIAGSQYMQRQAQRAGIPAARIDLVANAIDGSRFDEASARPIPGIQPGYVLFVGRLARSKGLPYLLEAMARLSPGRAQLLIVGDGRDRAETQRHVRLLGLEDRVRLLGHRRGEELSWLYLHAGLVAFPSVWAEVFGNVGLEAMAAAKPVVAFDVGGVSQWLEDRVNGFLVPAKEVAGLAARIETLLADSQLAARLGAAGREKFLRRFTTQQQASRLLAVYRSVLPKRLHAPTSVPCTSST